LAARGTEPVAPLARWSQLLALLGLAASVYLSAVHYAHGSIPLACSSAGVVNCDLVTSSAESMIGPLPVAVLGVVWFGAYLLLSLVRGAGVYRLAWAGIGLAFVFYLVYAELFLIGAVCLWCTAVHLIVVMLFLLSIADTTAEVAEF
jgi:uncharacterized membrane protein